jgi:hypothetical protein
MLNSVTSRDFENLERDVYQDEHEFLPSRTAITATEYFHGTARLLERIKYALRECEAQPLSDKTNERLQKLVREAEQLDAGMKGWGKNEPGWDMMKVKESSSGTIWSASPSHAIYFFHNFWVYLYWLRCLIARVKLYEGLMVVIGRQSQHRDLLSDRRKSTDESDFKISSYRTIVQLTAGQIIGLTAYALGDVTNNGMFRSPTTAKDLGSSREINVVATMQLVIPLKVLQRSNIPTAVQKVAIDSALSHIGDGFRR